MNDTQLINGESCDYCEEEVKSPYVTWIVKGDSRIYYSGHKYCMVALRNKKLKEQEERT